MTKTIRTFVNAVGETTTIEQVDTEGNPFFGRYCLTVWDDPDELGRKAKAPTLLDADLARELTEAFIDLGLVDPAVIAHEYETP